MNNSKASMLDYIDARSCRCFIIIDKTKMLAKTSRQIRLSKSMSLHQSLKRR